MSALKLAIRAMENGWLPDSIIRFGSRQLCRQRVQEANTHHSQDRHQSLVKDLMQKDVAEVPDVANQQHYEIPPRFF